jgi:hypothetical protein
MEINCPKCKTNCKIADTAIGKSVRCKNTSCQFVFVVNPPDFVNRSPENKKSDYQEPKMVVNSSNKHASAQNNSSIGISHNLKKKKLMFVLRLIAIIICAIWIIGYIIEYQANRNLIDKDSSHVTEDNRYSETPPFMPSDQFYTVEVEEIIELLCIPKYSNQVIHKDLWYSTFGQPSSSMAIDDNPYKKIFSYKTKDGMLSLHTYVVGEDRELIMILEYNRVYCTSPNQKINKDLLKSLVMQAKNKYHELHPVKMSEDQKKEFNTNENIAIPSPPILTEEQKKSYEEEEKQQIEDRKQEAEKRRMEQEGVVKEMNRRANQKEIEDKHIEEEHKKELEARKQQAILRAKELFADIPTEPVFKISKKLGIKNLKIEYVKDTGIFLKAFKKAIVDSEFDDLLVILELGGKGEIDKDLVENIFEQLKDHEFPVMIRTKEDLSKATCICYSDFIIKNLYMRYSFYGWEKHPDGIGWICSWNPLMKEVLILPNIFNKRGSTINQAREQISEEIAKTRRRAELDGKPFSNETENTLQKMLTNKAYESFKKSLGNLQPIPVIDMMKDTNTINISNENEIVEGVGWKQFCVGATKEELIIAFGKPDSNTDDKWLQWKKKYIHCLIDNTQGAFELRFDAGFKGKTTEGIEIGSSLKQAIEAYGEPDSTEVKNNKKKLEWSSKGIMIWFNNDKTNQIVVFKPYT